MVSTTSGNSASIAAPIAFNARIKGPIGEPFSWAITASSDCEGRNRNVSSIHYSSRACLTLFAGLSWHNADLFQKVRMTAKGVWFSPHRCLAEPFVVEHGNAE